MALICISGWKGSGKDMLAAYLIEKYGATRVSFADPLKDGVASDYGIDRSSLDDPNRKETPILTMPVDPQDKYSKMIAEFLIKEFRNKDGKVPTGFFYSHHGFLGTFENTGFEGYVEGMTLYDKAYWTPRALAILEGSTKRSARSNHWVQKAIEKAKNVNGMVVISDLRYKSELSQIKAAFGDDVTFIRVNRFKESPSNDPSERDLDDGEFNGYVDNFGTKEQAFVELEEILSYYHIK